MSKTKDTIEGLKRLQTAIIEGGVNLLAKHWIEIIPSTIQIARAQEQAEGMLKKKKLRKETMVEDGARQENACIEPYNEAISIAQPVLAKKILEIERGKEYGKEMAALAMDNAKLVDKLKLENKELLERMKIAEDKAREQYQQKWDIIKELQSAKNKIEELEKKLFFQGKELEAVASVMEELQEKLCEFHTLKSKLTVNKIVRFLRSEDKGFGFISHSGDCTSEAHTCLRCLCLDVAKALIKELGVKK